MENRVGKTKCIQRDWKVTLKENSYLITIQSSEDDYPYQGYLEGVNEVILLDSRWFNGCCLESYLFDQLISWRFL